MFAYCLNNPVNMVDHNGLWTYSVGLSFAGSPSFWNFNGSVCVTIDSYLNVVPQATNVCGVTTGTPSCSGVLYCTITNAPSYDKLNGQGFQAGGSYAAVVNGVPLATSLEMNIIPNDTIGTTYYGGTVGVGLGIPGGEGHIEWGETKSFENRRINLRDVSEQIYSKARRWFDEIF